MFMWLDYVKTCVLSWNQVAPYNAYYSQLGEHMALVGVDPGLSRWDQPLTLGMVDPHDSLSHPAGVSDVQAESPACVDPDQFTNFIVSSQLIILIKYNLLLYSVAMLFSSSLFPYCLIF